MSKEIKNNTRSIRIEEEVWNMLQKLAEHFNKRGRAEYITQKTKQEYSQIFGKE